MHPPLDLLAVSLTFVLVMDPFGNIPVFLAILKSVEEKRRRTVIIREMCFALVILSVFLFFGDRILAAMRIGEPALGIAGGIVLFLIALNMVFPGSGVSLAGPQEEEPFIVPMAVPLIAGPSMMAVVILFSSRYPGQTGLLFLSLGIAWLIAIVILLGASILKRFLGQSVLKAVEKLTGLILITIAV